MSSDVLHEPCKTSNDMFIMNLAKHQMTYVRNEPFKTSDDMYIMNLVKHQMTFLY
jgi:hypothetical protein